MTTRQSCRCCGVVDGREFLGGVITSQEPLSDEQLVRIASALRDRNIILALPAGCTYEPADRVATYWIEPDWCAACAISLTPAQLANFPSRLPQGASA